MTITAPTAGIAGALSRVGEIRARFEVPAQTATPASTALGSSASTSDFAQMLLSATGRTDLAPALSSYGSMYGSTGANSTGEALVDKAKTYLGTPYVWGGTDPNVGLDCSGFTQRVHRDMGIEIPRVSRDQARGGRPVASLDEARPGDVLAFGEPVNHVAIYAGDGMMVHSPRRNDVVTFEAIDRPVTAIRRYTPDTPVAGTSTVSFGQQPLAGASPTAYDSLFAAAGARYGIDPRVLSAVAKVESGYNPNAVSSAGAQGLMQFMPSTAAGMGIDPLDPAQAIDGAARYLSTQQRDFGSLELALAAYNAGPGAVRRYGGIPPYTQTQTYVSKVMGILNGAA